MNKSSLAVLSLFSFLLIFTTVSVAQLGEVAGQPHFLVNLGGSNSIVITILSQAGYPLPIKVILPTLTSTDANAITPIVTATPMEANVPVGGDLYINVTVHMPEGTNKPGYSWSGVLQVVAVSNSSSGGGAQILEGVAKIVSVTAEQHVPSIWDYLWLMILIVAIVVAIVVVFFLRSRGMLGGRAAKAVRSSRAAVARKARKRRRAKGKGATKHRRKRAVAGRTRKAAGLRATRRRRRR